MLNLNLQFFAHKKGVGSTKNGRDSESKRLGAKRADGQFVKAGNILYKALEQFGGFTAAGPILQGFASPVSDLSRGSTKEDVLSVIDVEMKLVESRRGF